ncbi:nucleoside hydrolase [Flavilitoribacter nigricans]|uniref:Nucleoside hydrolase n=1 Tax=Flavilitoribacter nigricans (strain ATCC 23147 / DSM 23189 / NBRC 102662 / NCIMB 1420 / SS-2) TaxID=1122177 RepID=A0A2D0MY86_FLAN2|nr:nucleoside hydrolase [Flavilitoribacter nigricans]PHN01205.1 nucleoside hydrolase [Flavilitoribacter nigricans DSM 23189 = NBRC 102662]
MRYRTILLICLFITHHACTPAEPEEEATPSLALAEAEGAFGDPVKLILDTDTANEIDDLYAIARLLPEDRINLLGITSAQWFHVLSGDSTVYQSQRLNEEMLGIADRMDLPHPLGADMIMGMPWGGDEARESEATTFIIDQVKALPEGEKLVVMSIGATTNLASAIALAPEIAPKIVAYTLGFQYDHERGVWDKDEFNIRRDLNAANFLLNREDLELHIMPTSVAVKYTWPREDTFGRLDQLGAMGAYLKQKWLERFPDNDSWVMWDVALVHAFLDPDMAPETPVRTPPENVQRRIWMYSDLDFSAMQTDYWETMNYWKP